MCIVLSGREQMTRLRMKLKKQTVKTRQIQREHTVSNRSSPTTKMLIKKINTRKQIVSGRCESRWKPRLRVVFNEGNMLYFAYMVRKRKNYKVLTSNERFKNKVNNYNVLIWSYSFVHSSFS